jgi:CheY-like chemotaxis protein
MQGDREKIMDSGFDDYLSKPVNSNSLIQELDRLLGS